MSFFVYSDGKGLGAEGVWLEEHEEMSIAALASAAWSYISCLLGDRFLVDLWADSNARVAHVWAMSGTFLGSVLNRFSA